MSRWTLTWCIMQQTSLSAVLELKGLQTVWKLLITIRRHLILTLYLVKNIGGENFSISTWTNILANIVILLPLRGTLLQCVKIWCKFTHFLGCYVKYEPFRAYVFQTDCISYHFLQILSLICANKLNPNTWQQHWRRALVDGGGKWNNRRQIIPS